MPHYYSNDIKPHGPFYAIDKESLINDIDEHHDWCYLYRSDGHLRAQRIQQYLKQLEEVQID